jgi:hypothetical protein
MARVALKERVRAVGALRRSATLPGRIKRRDQPVGCIPATVDAGRALDKPPLVVGRLDWIQRLPGRRGRLVELPQRFGDRRAMLFKHRHRDRQVGPDVVWDQVGKVARLRQASTSSTRERPSGRARFAVLAPGSTAGHLAGFAHEVVEFGSAWVTSRRSTRRRAHAVMGQADGTKRLEGAAAENPWPKRLLAEVEPEKDTLQGLTKGNL